MSLFASTGMKTLFAQRFAQAFTGGVIYVYSGVQPSSPDRAPTGTLLAVVTPDGLPHTLGSPVNGLQLTDGSGGFVALADGQALRLTAVASGTAGWARLMTYNDTLQSGIDVPRFDMAVNDPAAGSVGSLLIGDPAITINEVRSVGYFLFGIPPFGATP